jgi:hypothetical protein
MTIVWNTGSEIQRFNILKGRIRETGGDVMFVAAFFSPGLGQCRQPLFAIEFPGLAEGVVTPGFRVLGRGSDSDLGRRFNSRVEAVSEGLKAVGSPVHGQLEGASSRPAGRSGPGAMLRRLLRLA